MNIFVQDGMSQGIIVSHIVHHKIIFNLYSTSLHKDKLLVISSF